MNRPQDHDGDGGQVAGLPELQLRYEPGVSPMITISIGDRLLRLTTAQARQVARALCDAADETDGLVDRFARLLPGDPASGPDQLALPDAGGGKPA
jgi:hypothetical protein